MPFYSKFAEKIWDTLYTVYIPDQLTQDSLYIKKFGTYVTQNRVVNEMLKTNMIMVKIPIIKILEYFLDGIEIQIPSREDMIKIHKDIEGYLLEWKNYLKYSVHGNQDAINHKDLILSLEKLSKHIFNKCRDKELITNLFVNKNVNFGLLDPITKHVEENKSVKRPDYEGIKHLIKHRKQNSPPGGRF